jgi:uncharacterized Zn finger protein (UPF0148 family)
MTRGNGAATAAAGFNQHPGRARQRTEVVQIAFLRWLLGRDRADESVEVPVEVAPPPPPPPEPAPVTWVACPNCGVALDPPPEHTRLCPRCRHRVVVRHSEGRAIYLTEAAVKVFESERQREIDEQTWTRERRSWLQLARLAGAPADRRRRVAAAPLTAAAVKSSRTLYLVAAERAVRAARRGKRWDEVARIRRRQAAALFEEAGGSPPLADEIVVLYREGAAATLRALAGASREAELVGASCCPACRADNERIFRIADELRTPRLPHAGCPRGLCACDWWPALRDPAAKRRRRRASPASPVASPTAVADGADAAPPPADRATSVSDAGADAVADAAADPA